MSVRRKIIKNLEGRVNPMNEMCTTRGLGMEESRNELYTMLREGIISVEYFLKTPLYKLTFVGRDMAKGKPALGVDTSASNVVEFTTRG